MKKINYLYCYDVREPKRLRRVEKRFRGYGQRVQYSIFRCRLTPREHERLRWELEKEMDGDDSLLVIELCKRCSSAVTERREEIDWAKDPPTYLIV